MEQEATYGCIQCHKKRPGRFTRHRHASGQGWSQGMTLPSWYCWTCLPPGEGRDEAAENEDMMAKAAQTSVVPVAKGRSEALAKSHEILTLVPPLKTEVDELTITDAESYAYADSILGRVREARGVWGRIWDRLQEKTIKPIRSGLDELYGLNREVDTPLNLFEEKVKAKMKAFKLVEKRLLAESEAKKQAEIDRLRKEAEAKAEAETTARTRQMREKLQAARQTLTTLADTIEESEDPEPVKGEHSSERNKPAWRVKDIRAVFTAIGNGTLPLELGILNVPKMNRCFKDDPEAMKAWPGIEVFEDVQIVGR